MNLLYKIFGYLGILPFLFFALLILSEQFSSALQVSAISFLQYFYGVMILNFLAGIHWVKAMEQNNKVRLSLSMLPAILCLLLIFLVILTQSSIIPLLFLVLSFWGVYMLDRFYQHVDNWSSDYMIFRMRITLIVSFILLLHAGYLYVL